MRRHAGLFISVPDTAKAITDAIATVSRRDRSVLMEADDRAGQYSIRISADPPLRLARFFGTSKRFWMNLQARYDLEIEKDRLGPVLDNIQPLTAASLRGSNYQPDQLIDLIVASQPPNGMAWFEQRLEEMHGASELGQWSR